MGYILESWKQYDEAVALYEDLLSANDNDLQNWRNLALACYQQGRYQKAVDIFYAGLTKARVADGTFGQTLQAMMLQEMNAIIAIHKDVLDLSAIRKELIRPLAVDLRITLDCNTRDLYGNAIIVEPGGQSCSSATPETKNGGRMNRNEYYYSEEPQEYQVKEAKEGKYKIKVRFADYGSYYQGIKVPAVVRVITFRNFGKAGQSLLVENVIMDNQYGEVEIAAVDW